MFGLQIIRKSEIESLKAEIKGYYGGDNQDNAYLKQLQRLLQGNDLPTAVPMARLQVKEAYETNAPLFGIINMIASNVGEVSKYLELTNKKTGDVIDATDKKVGWVISLLNKPNDRMSLSKYVEGWAINRLLFGDAWQYAPKTLGKAIIGKELMLIPSHNVEVEKGGLEKPFRGIKLIGMDSREIPIEDIIESFSYNLDPTTAFGTSPVVAAAQYLSVIDTGMNRQNTALKNGGAASIITPKGNELGIKPSDAQEVEQKSNSNKNANKHITFKVPIEVHQLGNTPIDLNILSSHKEAVTALCFVYHLPVDLYYGQSKYENAKEAKKTIYEQNAIPLAEEFANDVLGHFDLSGEYKFVVNTDKIDVLQDNPYDASQKMASIGAFTTNEIRETAGWDAIDEDWANEVRLPIGLQLGNETYDIDEE